MTPDSPKGPEREVQIEIDRLEQNEAFLERAIHLLLGCCDASEVPCEEPDAGVLYEHVRNGTSPQSLRAVIEQANLLRFDLEEADRSFEFVRKQRDRFGERSVERGKELTAIRSALVDLAQESMPPHVSTLQAVRWLIAEHDEQVKHNEEVGGENGVLCDERDRLQAEVSRLREQLAAAARAIDPEAVAVWLFRAKTSRLQHDAADRAQSMWDNVLDHHDREAWLKYATVMIEDLKPAASVSESVPVTPQRIGEEQRRVLNRGNGYADCAIEAATPMDSVYVTRAELMAGILVGIGGEHDVVPTQEQLDRTVDMIFRHAQRRDAANLKAAEKLVPILFPETDPLRASAPSEVSMEEEHDHVPTLAALKDQRRRYTRTSEGLPSGSERLAPQQEVKQENPVPDDGGIPWHERHDAIMAERDDWRQTCEEAEARNVHLLMLITDLFGDFRDAATRYSKLVDQTPEHVLDLMNYWAAQRDQQDAAQAARSEATPEESFEVGSASKPSATGGSSDTARRVWAEVDLQPCPEDIRWVRDCNNFVWRRLVNDQWVTGHRGDGPCGWPYLIKKFGPITEASRESLTTVVPRVWQKGDPAPADNPRVRDNQGDVWTYDENTQMWDTPETVQCSWAYVAKKWAPLTEVLSCTEQEEE